jgi:DNA-directed RNA polymerase specialized sigma24 family protein
VSLDSDDFPENPRTAVEAACLYMQKDLQLFLLGILRSQHLADDAWQRTVVLALQSSHSARPQTLRGWLFQIALNEARKILRENRKHPALTDPASLADISSSAAASDSHTLTSPDFRAIRQETSKIVQDCLKSLPPNSRKLFGNGFTSVEPSQKSLQISICRSAQYSRGVAAVSFDSEMTRG